MPNDDTDRIVNDLKDLLDRWHTEDRETRHLEDYIAYKEREDQKSNIPWKIYGF